MYNRLYIYLYFGVSELHYNIERKSRINRIVLVYTPKPIITIARDLVYWKILKYKPYFRLLLFVAHLIVISCINAHADVIFNSIISAKKNQCAYILRYTYIHFFFFFWKTPIATTKILLISYLQNLLNTWLIIRGKSKIGMDFVNE